MFPSLPRHGFSFLTDPMEDSAAPSSLPIQFTGLWVERLNRQERDEHEAGAPIKLKMPTTWNSLVSKYLLLLAVRLSPSLLVHCVCGEAQDRKANASRFPSHARVSREQDLLLSSYILPPAEQVSHEIL